MCVNILPVQLVTESRTVGHHHIACIVHRIARLSQVWWHRCVNRIETEQSALEEFARVFRRRGKHLCVGKSYDVNLALHPKRLVRIHRLPYTRDTAEVDVRPTNIGRVLKRPLRTCERTTRRKLWTTSRYAQCSA